MQKQAWRKMKKTALVLSAAMFVTCTGGAYTPDAQAASKAPTLSATSLSLKKGQTKKITIKTSKKEKIKKTTWKVNNKKLEIVKKAKKSLTIKALKTGTVTISAKIKTNKKTYTKKVKVSIAAKSTPKPVATETPVTPTEPAKTDVPNITPEPQNPGNSDIPAPTEEPTETKAPDETDNPTITDAPVKTNAPVVDNPILPEIPEELIQGTLAAKSSWHDGQLANISAIYTGKKVRFTVKVREQGVTNPTGTMKIKSNYNNSYPTLATFDLSTEWQTITFEYRFNEFTNQYACFYFDDEKDDTSGDLNMYYRDFDIEVLDQGDDLGGTSIANNEWNMITVASLRNGTTNPHKFYENKKVHVSFSIRERGVADPTGVTLDLQTNPNNSYPVVKSNIALGTAWTDVEFDYTFGEITNTYPSLYFAYKDALADMELFIKDFSITVTGEVEPTPTPEATEAPETPAGGDIKVPLTSTGVYASGCLENSDGTSCTPTYGEDGSVTFTTSNQYSGGGMAFYLKGDKSKVDLSGYSGVKIVVEGTASEQVVISPFSVATASNGIFTPVAKVDNKDVAKYVSLTGSEQEINIDFETETAWGKVSDAYAIFVKYNAYQKGDYDNDAKLYATVKIKSITFIAKEGSADPGETPVGDDYVIDFKTVTPAEYTWRGYSSAGIDSEEGYFWYEYGSTDHEWDSGYYGYPIIKVTLPEGKTLADYDSISLKYKGLAGDANYKTVKAYIIKEKTDANGNTKPTISIGQASTGNAMTDWVELTTGFEISAETVAADLNDLTASTFWIAIDAGCGNAESNGAQTKFAIDDLTFHAKAAED